MTATPEVDLPDVSTILNPATGAVAGQVRWTDPADVPRIAAGLRQAQIGSGKPAAPKGEPRCLPATRCGWASIATRSSRC